MANWRDRILEEAEAARKRSPRFDIDFDALRREDEAETGGFFGGFALGVIVGAILALVFAPQKGDETRDLVSERAMQFKDRATEFVAQVRGDDEPDDEEPAIEREMEIEDTTVPSGGTTYSN
jgi:hypothetical protein